MNSALFIALRRMRLPIIALIVVYAIGVLGLTLIPGVDAAGNPWRMSLFDAFYFVSYTGASIGFGELPNAFSRPQRLWVTAVIYLSVLVWAYTIGTLLALMRDRSFRETLRRQRFARAVRLLREPFYLICGIGETGMMVGRTLDRTAVRFVAIDVREERIAELDLQDFIANVPALAADARTPANLLAAGLKHPQCVGVLALTSDDAANLAVGIATKLLHPGVPVLCRALDGAVESNMASFGTDHIINPFAAFGELLELAVAQPGHYRLFSLLTGMPGRSRKRRRLRRTADGSCAVTAASGRRSSPASRMPACRRRSSIPSLSTGSRMDCQARGSTRISSAAPALRRLRCGKPGSLRPWGSSPAPTTTCATCR